MVISVRADGSAPAPLPKDEQARLEALRAYLVLDTPADPSFDRITDLASRICDAPIATITLIDADRQWFKSVVGFDERETPRDWAFCSHTILETGALPMVVPDAHLDARFRTNPVTVGSPYLRFYAGAPLITPSGHKLGTLCVADTSPRRSLGFDLAEILQILSGLTIDLLELHKLKVQPLR